MGGRSIERKLAAILSADVEGYSRLMGDDEVATVRAITDYREVIASAVAGHGGRVVDAPGDNVLAEFASVVDAVQCAVDIQRALQQRNAELPPSRQMRFRIATDKAFHHRLDPLLHIGRVIDAQCAIRCTQDAERLAKPGFRAGFAQHPVHHGLLRLLGVPHALGVGCNVVLAPHLAVVIG